MDLGVCGRNKKATSAWPPTPPTNAVSVWRLCAALHFIYGKTKKKKAFVLDLMETMKGHSLSSDLCQLFISCFQQTSPSYAL